MKGIALRIALAALVLLCCGCAAFGFFDDEDLYGDDIFIGDPVHGEGSGGNG